VYYLLPMCEMYIEICLKFSVSCLLFWNYFTYRPTRIHYVYTWVVLSSIFWTDRERTLLLHKLLLLDVDRGEISDSLLLEIQH
jgi:hypothetical protein